MAIAADNRSPKLKLLDVLLVRAAGIDTRRFVGDRRALGDSWADIAARIFSITGETISTTWLIRKFGDELTPDGAA